MQRVGNLDLMALELDDAVAEHSDNRVLRRVFEGGPRTGPGSLNPRQSCDAEGDGERWTGVLGGTPYDNRQFWPTAGTHFRRNIHPMQ